MDTRHAQMLLASTGYYTAAIDGDAGPKTQAAIRVIERNSGMDRDDWPWSRRLVAAAQTVLGAQGFEPGAIDGWHGHNTREALTAWLSARAATDTSVDRSPLPVDASTAQARYPLQRDMAAFYGPAGARACTAGHVRLPFAFRLSWAPEQKVSRFFCHERLADPMTAIFADAVRHYGEARYVELRLDLFGGCYNYRKMRGGASLSTHAWGAAVDLDPERNQLRWGADRAAFARPEYDDWWRIVKSHGATPAGHAWGKDWMHFQFARL